MTQAERKILSGKIFKLVNNIFNYGRVAQVRDHSPEHYGSELDKYEDQLLELVIAEKEKERERYQPIFDWLMGLTEFRLREEGEGKYWWRIELKERLKSLKSPSTTAQGYSPEQSPKGQAGMINCKHKVISGVSGGRFMYCLDCKKKFWFSRPKKDDWQVIFI